MTRNYTNFQIFLFIILLSAAYCSESINEFAAAKWKSFSKQQYFDSNGLFISTVFSIPILLNWCLDVQLAANYGYTEESTAFAESEERSTRKEVTAC